MTRLLLRLAFFGSRSLAIAFAMEQPNQWSENKSRQSGWQWHNCSWGHSSRRGGDTWENDSRDRWEDRRAHARLHDGMTTAVADTGWVQQHEVPPEIYGRLTDAERLLIAKSRMIDANGRPWADIPLAPLAGHVSIHLDDEDDADSEPLFDVSTLDSDDTADVTNPTHYTVPGNLYKYDINTHPIWFDLAMIRGLPPQEWNWKHHNIALQWHRFIAESADATFVNFAGDLFSEHNVATCYNPGPVVLDSMWRPSEPIRWNWGHLLKDLDEPSQKYLFQGLRKGTRRRGIISCRLQKTYMYDKTRHDDAWERQRNTDNGRYNLQTPYAGSTVRIPQGPPGMESDGSPRKWRIWNFVFTLSDGVEVHMHPRWDTHKVLCSTGIYDSCGLPIQGCICEHNPGLPTNIVANPLGQVSGNLVFADPQPRPKVPAHCCKKPPPPAPPLQPTESSDAPSSGDPSPSIDQENAPIPWKHAPTSKP